VTSGSASWYDVVTGGKLLQGDILRECPLPSLTGLADWPLKPDDELDIDIRLADACVLSQSCDLENNKIDEVLLAQVVDWDAGWRALVAQGNPSAKGTRFRESLVAGNVPGLALLRKHEGSPIMEWSLVDFRRIFVLPKPAAAAVAVANGERLRLIPPYREHLGQAFARYFMRVGLPLNAAEFVAEGATT